MLGKNLKAHPELLMELRRKVAVENFIVELSFNPNVYEIGIEWSKNILTILINGTTKVFKKSEPFSNIKKEVEGCITVN